MASSISPELKTCWFGVWVRKASSIQELKILLQNKTNCTSLPVPNLNAVAAFDTFFFIICGTILELSTTNSILRPGVNKKAILAKLFCNES